MQMKQNISIHEHHFHKFIVVQFSISILGIKDKKNPSKHLKFTTSASLMKSSTSSLVRVFPNIVATQNLISIYFSKVAVHSICNKSIAFLLMSWYKNKYIQKQEFLKNFLKRHISRIFKKCFRKYSLVIVFFCLTAKISPDKSTQFDKR